MLNLFASTPKGIAPLLAAELHTLGAGNIRETAAGAHFEGDLALAYRVCLWSRLANRVLLPLADFPAHDPDQLYQGAQQIDWPSHMDVDSTLAVACTLSKSSLQHSQYAAQKIKDAVVDQFRERCGRRPSVAVERPALPIHCHVEQDHATISIDLSGESLHRRGYRTEQGAAPLKENLAAAILLRAGWPDIAASGGALVDPLCGSGTLLIEAAMMATDMAPGLRRDYYGFPGWLGHQQPVWTGLLEEAEERRREGKKRLPPIKGFDQDDNMVNTARRNCNRAGFAFSIKQQALDACTPGEHDHGLIVSNPPYGERLGEASTLPMLYRTLGSSLKRCYPGWQASLITGEGDLHQYLGLRAHKTHTLFNGALRCKLLHFEISSERRSARETATDFANRLDKNLKRLRRWAKREQIACYRVYDADLPEYNLAIDVYNIIDDPHGNGCHVHVQEYEAPKDIDAHKAQQRLNTALAVIQETLDLPADALHFKQRRRQREGSQYEKLGDSGEYYIVQESGAKFLVNFTDHLDTGLFLDHRPVRNLIQQQANGKRFLNLFCYTGSATVCAALGGANSSTSIDLSNTYIDWARRNLAINELDPRRHEFIQDDVRDWLLHASGKHKVKYDLVFLDPPSFSRSKRMTGTFDVQRDHVVLIEAIVKLLAEDGELIFSTNLRKFKLDSEALANLKIEDISKATLPEDFSRNARIHQCFRIRSN